MTRFALGSDDARAVLRLMVAGSRKPLDRPRYQRLLHAQDTALLKILKEFGESSPSELHDLAVSLRSKFRFAVLTQPTVVDWVSTAQRRGLIEPTEPAGRWRLSGEGRSRAGGWRRHVGPLSRSFGALVQWAIALAFGTAAFGVITKIDWDGVPVSEALVIVAIVAAYALFLVLYAAFFRFTRSVTSLQLIELTRKTGEPLGLDVETRLPARKEDLPDDFEESAPMVRNT